MSQSERGPLAVILFTLGGGLLVYVFYEILDNVGKPWIDRTSFLVLLVLPYGLIAFLLLGLGLLLMFKSQKGSVTS